MAANIRGYLENSFQCHFFDITVNVKFSSDLKFEHYCEYYAEILLQVSLKWETKIDGRGHEIFSEKIIGPWNILAYGLLSYEIFFEKFVKTSHLSDWI